MRACMLALIVVVASNMSELKESYTPSDATLNVQACPETKALKAPNPKP